MQNDPFQNCFVQVCLRRIVSLSFFCIFMQNIENGHFVELQFLQLHFRKEIPLLYSIATVIAGFCSDCRSFIGQGDSLVRWLCNNFAENNFNTSLCASMMSSCFVLILIPVLNSKKTRTAFVLVMLTQRRGKNKCLIS